MLEIEPGLAMCKAITLLSVLSIQPPHKFFFYTSIDHFSDCYIDPWNSRSHIYFILYSLYTMYWYLCHLSDLFLLGILGTVDSAVLRFEAGAFTCKACTLTIWAVSLCSTSQVFKFKHSFIWPPLLFSSSSLPLISNSNNLEHTIRT